MLLVGYWYLKALFGPRMQKGCYGRRPQIFSRVQTFKQFRYFSPSIFIAGLPPSLFEDGGSCSNGHTPVILGGQNCHTKCDCVKTHRLHILLFKCCEEVDIKRCMYHMLKEGGTFHSNDIWKIVENLFLRTINCFSSILKNKFLEVEMKSGFS